MNYNTLQGPGSYFTVDICSFLANIETIPRKHETVSTRVLMKRQTLLKSISQNDYNHFIHIFMSNLRLQQGLEDKFEVEKVVKEP